MLLQIGNRLGERLPRKGRILRRAPLLGSQPGEQFGNRQRKRGLALVRAVFQLKIERLQPFGKKEKSAGWNKFPRSAVR